MTAGGEMYSFSAALLKLPASTTQINVSSCGLYIRLTIPFFRGFPYLILFITLTHLDFQLTLPTKLFKLLFQEVLLQ